MKYRPLVKNENSVSVLGLGTMRFPTKGSKSLIDEVAAKQIVLSAIEQGVNYIDTGYTYHNGYCEEFIGKIVPNEYRNYVDIVTKMPLWIIESHADLDKVFCEQMKRLRTTYFKYYMFHALNRQTWGKMKCLDVFNWIEKRKSDGSIGHIGFSFHDDLAVFIEIVDGYDWDFCQIQYNYIQEDYQAGIVGLRYANAKDIGVIVMEPLLGGILANPPEKVTNIFAGANSMRTPADWALQWLWNKAEISTVLSGVNNLHELSENILSASNSGVGSLQESDYRLLSLVRDVYYKMKEVFCTKCEYCLPCPKGVDILHNLEIYNLMNLSSGPEIARDIYIKLNPEKRANMCAECGLCEANCPQKISIIDYLHMVASKFKSKA